MSINPAGCLPAIALDQPAARDSHTDDALTSSFAGMLAGAMHSAAPKPLPAKTRDGASELDRANTKDNADDPKKSTTAKHDEDGSTTVHTATDAVPPGEIVRSIAALDPALQGKLARVIARLHDETGHDATVAETYRSQSRQDELYAQGRNAPGPVVTWTRASKHSEGRAVDLVLDGGTAGPDAYAALQRIANEEGLRTLGARDPGHLELPQPSTNLPAANFAKAINTVGTGASRSKNSDPSTSSVGQTKQAPVAQVARLAQVAHVAGVAGPAPVARVATVAAVADPNGVRRLAGPSRESEQRSGAGDSGAQSNPRGGSDSFGGTFSLRGAAAQTVASLDTTSAATSAARAADAIAAQEDAPARPLSRISMAVDAGNGVPDRIQVTLRGSSLSTTIDTADPRAAHAMTTRSNELIHALTRDGVDVESVRVRSTATVAASTAAQPSRDSSNSSTSSRFERGDAWQHQTERQRSQDDRRRNQQREQRGGKTQ